MQGVVITSGHQPGFHHPGILAKRFALDSEAGSSHTKGMWLVADQDVDDPEVIRYPDLDEQGRLIARSWRLLSSDRGTPTALRPWGTLSPPPTVSRQLPESIQAGLIAIHDSLESVEATTVAQRFTAANERLLEGLVKHEVTLIRASELLETDPGRTAIKRIVENPKECAHIWNEGLELAPRAARSLKISSSDPEDTEVPAWVISSDGARKPATVRDLKSAIEGSSRIMPRAFLMTAVFRNLSDAPMIHGTGGGRYEVVTDYWAREFLGLKLPPIQVVTCDLRLPLEGFVDSATHPRVQEAIRALEHNPWNSAATKRAWLERIQEAPRGSVDRRKLFGQMHQAISEQRGFVEGELGRMRTVKEQQATQHRQEQIAHSRSWAWPLYDQTDLLDMMHALS